MLTVFQVVERFRSAPVSSRAKPALPLLGQATVRVLAAKDKVSEGASGVSTVVAMLQHPPVIAKSVRRFHGGRNAPKPSCDREVAAEQVAPGVGLTDGATEREITTTAGAAATGNGEPVNGVLLCGNPHSERHQNDGAKNQQP